LVAASRESVSTVRHSLSEPAAAERHPVAGSSRVTEHLAQVPLNETHQPFWNAEPYALGRSSIFWNWPSSDARQPRARPPVW
jgi:hypothetical protein